MVDDAADDEFNRVTLDNGTVLWFVTEEKIGFVYADGIDNDGDGDIDEGIDLYVDDASEIWYDGVDNDGDGHIDESDERGSSWLDRFGNTISGIPYTTVFSNPDSVWTILDSTHKFGFGDYKYDSEGNIVFDTNKNGVYDDDWGTNGKDDDGDWGPYIDANDKPWDVGEEDFDDLDGNGFHSSEYYYDTNGNGVWDPAEPFTDLNENGSWDNGEPYTDLNGNELYSNAELFLDWGLDGAGNTGDYGEGNGVWDSEPILEDLNWNGVWDWDDGCD
jgi:hypothetical protein